MLTLSLNGFPTTILNKKKVDWQLSVLDSIARNHSYRLHLEPIIADEIEIAKKSAYIQLHNSAFLSFVNQWCMIFGSDKEKAHWKNVAYEPKDPVYQGRRDPSFSRIQDYWNFCRSYFNSYCGISDGQRALVWTSMREARDKYAAHLDIDSLPQMPFADIPYEIAKAYSNLLLNAYEEVPGDYCIYPLEEKDEDFADEINSILPS